MTHALLPNMLLVAAFILSLLAAWRHSSPSERWWHLGWLAMACYFLSLLLGVFKL